ncbi:MULTISPECIES: SCP2 domain-containing protein [Chromohalobacter]|uniref:Ubiquinone biosynthesis accessory factor UbiT n=3 Tax=Chromohalobacter TaxID=42054 RepID=A0A1Q8TFN9_9GAMM|nr:MULTISPECIES: SCP2 sterol-binding domain-containing protein [Chromohalobacter]MCK2045372.1 SCP2 sterol-binding domain-containing protein [Chromohalobacter moromii]MCT8504961.1 SCP2 sterol-binding domain-containing protein [Chromohalobacter moromii]MDV6317712.1 SCP2 sterol-binding domain-containing protein [Chromohalobacter sp. HP20-39]OLO12507.1 sterol-binding protein [Chromohalobacter japonicus]SOC53118.1 Predicted lipid carrier protein YhbT, contains SCP2 domain [Chromohalobacter canadens
MPLSLPPPLLLLRALDHGAPLALKRRLVEPLLNRTFAEPLVEGEFDALDGRRITLRVEELDAVLTLGLEAGRLVLCREAGEATIRGGWREFLCLATRHEDPDALFFQRRLLIEGDTELGLTVKNLLDGREEGLAQGRLGKWLERLERLVRHDRGAQSSRTSPETPGGEDRLS